MALAFKVSVLNVEMPLNDAFLFQNKENKILLDPPLRKKAQGYERYGYTHKCLSIPAARDLDIYWVEIEWFGLQSNPFTENYYLIIVIFHTHIQTKTHELST